MELKLLDQWMKDYEESIFNRLTLTQNLINKWYKSLREQRTLKVSHYKEEEGYVIIPEMRNCCGATVSPNWRRVVEPTRVLDSETLRYVYKDCTVIVDQIEIDGKMYDEHVFGGNYNAMTKKYNGLQELLADNRCTKGDFDWIYQMGRTEQDIRTKAHKDMLVQKKSIEARVRSICGEELTNIDDSKGDIFAKGTNGRTAHIWAIIAGGYNEGIIVNERHGQCAHIRVLVKEVR